MYSTVGLSVSSTGGALFTAAIDAVAMATNKKKFLAALAAGLAPGCAAKEIEISRSTAYNWKRDDSEFAAQWEEAG